MCVSEASAAAAAAAQSVCDISKSINGSMDRPLFSGFALATTLADNCAKTGDWTGNWRGRQANYLLATRGGRQASRQASKHQSFAGRQCTAKAQCAATAALLSYIFTLHDGGLEPLLFFASLAADSCCTALLSIVKHR